MVYPYPFPNVLKLECQIPVPHVRIHSCSYLGIIRPHNIQMNISRDPLTMPKPPMLRWQLVAMLSTASSPTFILTVKKNAIAASLLPSWDLFHIALRSNVWGNHFCHHVIPMRQYHFQSIIKPTALQLLYSLPAWNLAISLISSIISLSSQYSRHTFGFWGREEFWGLRFGR